MGGVLLLLTLTLTVAESASADATPPGRSMPVPYARFVPASARLFITIRRLDEVEEALGRAHAWRLLPLMADARTGKKGSFDLRGAITAFLGLQNSAEVDAVMRSGVGIAASSLSGLGNAVWFVRVPDKAAFERWFPPDRRVGATAAGSARFFRTKDGMMVCLREGMAAMARGAGRDSLFLDTLNLMNGSDGDTLENTGAFRRLAAHLPRRHLAMAYLVGDPRSLEGAVNPAPWWPAIDRMVVGLYEGRGRIDVAIRASLVAPYPKSRMAPSAIERLLRLPRTTLFALVATIDFEQAYEAATSKTPSGTLGRYLAALASIQGPPGAPAGERSKLGPHVILVWGQDLRAGSSAPQVALLVECTNGRALRDRSREAAEKFIGLLEAIEPAVADKGLFIQEGRHLGVPISSIPLHLYAQRSRLPFVKTLSNTEPAWTVWKGWLIMALSRDHIERILDAQFGLVPALATVEDVRRLHGTPGDRSVLSIVQADLAAEVLRQWLAKYEAGQPSLLDPALWAGWSGDRPGRVPQLGIGMRIPPEPGVVVVARVYRDTAAEGLLQPGDRILGIDGKLLSLSSPNRDLRRGWIDSKAQPGPTVRVRRGGEVMDIVLPKKPEETHVSSGGMNPADAVRELASLGDTLQFASFAVLASEEKHYSARLSLRFADSGVAKTTTSR